MSHMSPGETARLAALKSLRILHTEREALYDDLTALAASIFAAPIALISLVADDYQWFKSCVGLDVAGTPRDVSFCTHAIDREDLSTPFVVPDATLDPRFQNNPLVTGEPHIRMYVGVPLVSEEGHALGTLCVIDTQPHDPTPAELNALCALARSVTRHIELGSAVEKVRISEERNRLICATAPVAIITVDENGFVTDFNARAERFLGIPAVTAVGSPLADLISFRFVDSKLLGECPIIDPDAPINFDDVIGRDVELTLVGQFGKTLEVELTASAVKTSRGNMHILVMRDIADRRIQEAARQESQIRDVVVFAMARLAESRDSETGAHIERVQGYCRALAEQLARMGRHPTLIDPEFIQLMYTTSPLHDIGKVGISDDVLLKPGRLSSAEFEIMKTHTTIGAETLNAAMERFPQTRFLRMAKNIAESHHERWDGSGYPAGLRGEEIPLCGRIVALADVYDALMSRRVYKSALTHETAKSIILKESGTHFDPDIVEAFLAIEDTFRSIHDEHQEHLRLAA